MSGLGAELELRGVGKMFTTGDGVAGGVHPIDLDLPAGSFFTLLGPSGCGKTTTLRCIAGLEQPDRGLIRLGDDLFFDASRGMSLPMNRRKIGMVFQSYAIWPHMSVFENVAFPLRVAQDRKFSSGEITRMVDEALKTVELSGLGSRPATRLSGGQQQRVALARAIVRQPRLLLLDEPLSNLDAALREEMRTALKQLQQQIGVTTVYVTHDQAEALEMSDQIAVMQAGRVVQLGTSRDIYFRPRSAFVASFVGAANLFPGRLEGGTVARLADGTIMHCIAAADGAGGDVVVSVRPESITVQPETALAASGWNRLTGTVVTTGFLGSVSRCGVSVGGQMIHAMGGPHAMLSIGDRVALDFPPDAAVAMPA